MKTIIPTARYARDLKRVFKRKWDIGKIDAILQLFRTEQSLPENAHPHKLSGEYAGLWECHIGSDWLLIYDVTDTEILLARTGTHEDLFG